MSTLRGSYHYTLRTLLESDKKPTIIYASRTKTIEGLYKRLKADNFLVSKFYGKMENEDKIKNQNDFMQNKTNIMVATNAFGMGVDKDDVGVVIHYNISDSLENYVQEAGRAGRDPKSKANCYILYNDEDLNQHFDLLRQSKLSIKEIGQVWSGIKKATKYRNEFTKTALEISKVTGWSDTVYNLDTRVKTSVLALEDANLIERGMNSPRVYATSLLVSNMEQAIKILEKSKFYENEDIKISKRIISSLISNKRRSWQDDLAEARVDYLAENLGYDRRVIIRHINLLRESKILADDSDLYARITEDTVLQTLITNLNRYQEIFNYLINVFDESRKAYNLKVLNEEFINSSYKPNIKYLRTVLNYLKQTNALKVEDDFNNNFYENLLHNKQSILTLYKKNFNIAEFIISYLFDKFKNNNDLSVKSLIDFSLLELKNQYLKSLGLFKEEISLNNIEHIILMLQRLDILYFEGGFLVSYSPLTIKRIEKNNMIRYTIKDYEKLSNHYKNKNQQIHIVGRYAELMIEDKELANEFVSDYFNLSYKSFLDKHFPGSLKKELDFKMSKKRHEQLFGKLSKEQKEIVLDHKNNIIGVAAGPGSGKTTLLVHKLASIIYNEDIRTEQLLMLTFSRNAAIEFKERLKELIGDVANYIKITTFHSFAFDLLGRLGSIETSTNIVKEAVDLIKKREVDNFKITKMMLVIDEAQDISEDEYNLIKELIKFNEDIKVLAVGDDDQNIYEFRGSNSKYLKEITNNKKYELTINFRSEKNIVEYSNKLIEKNKIRIKTKKMKSSSNLDGEITVNYYYSENLIIPLVEDFIKESNKNKTSAIITRTNEEAFLVSGLLNEYGISNKLIQDTAKTKSYNVYELRKFYKMLEKDTISKIDLNVWSNTLYKFEQLFKESENFESHYNILNKFIEVYKDPYLSDFLEYLIQTEINDFETENELIVTNLHKVKGMEFDNVYLLYNYKNFIVEEELRALYVGITRTKTKLTIHTNSNLLKALKIKNMNYYENNMKYNEPEIIEQLFAYQEVHLGYFKYVRNNLLKLLPGDELTIKEDILYSNNKRVAKLSLKGSNQLKERINKDYMIEKIKVSDLVYWYNKDDEEEILILLAKFKFKLI